jgi:cell division septal protein FtsQ
MVKPLKSKFRKKGAGSALSVRVLGSVRKVFLRSLPYVMSLTTLGILFGSVVAYAVNSPTFQLREVHVLNMGTLTPEQAFKFSELQPGENLVHLDLVGVQQVIKRNHPEFKEVRVRRVLPDRVEILLKRRTPVAQALFSRYVQIDKDRVVLPGSSTVPFRNLTVIEGAPMPRGGLFVGTTLEDSATQKALRLMEVLKHSQMLAKHTLTKIDIGDPRNFAFFVDGIEIRIGNNHFIERLKILDQTLRTLALDAAKIRYIDLRFDDVVIGPR